MNVIIIEDEAPAARRLQSLIKECDENVTILTVLDSIANSIQWLNNNSLPDLIFMDIQLADGLSFEIFNRYKVKSPVIFTTAYDKPAK